MRVMASYETRTRRFSRAEYERLIELGVFQPGEPIELIGGELMVAEPQGVAHYTAIVKTEKALEAAFGPGWHARTQGPIGLDDDSEPEPDVAVVPGSPEDYSRAHPSRPPLTVMKQAERPALRRFTRHEYARLIDHGFLDEDEPIELLDGLLLVKEPQRSPHRTAVLLVAKAVERAFGEGWFVQTQSPIILGDQSEPEPDICVVRGSPRDYVDAHPTRPALIVEGAQSGLRLARGRKAAAYARAWIADYWIVNLVDRVLEVHREPARPGPARRHWGYAAIEMLGADATVTPLAAPSAAIRVADLLP